MCIIVSQAVYVPWLAMSSEMAAQIAVVFQIVL